MQEIWVYKMPLLFQLDDLARVKFSCEYAVVLSISQISLFVKLCLIKQKKKSWNETKRKRTTWERNLWWDLQGSRWQTLLYPRLFTILARMCMVYQSSATVNSLKFRLWLGFTVSLCWEFTWSWKTFVMVFMECGSVWTKVISTKWFSGIYLPPKMCYILIILRVQ